MEVDEQQPYDCQACGACCALLGPFTGDAYVPLDPDEAWRMRRLGLRVVEVAPGDERLGAAPHEGARGCPACVAFEGEVGVRCGCSVYAERPSLCRAFEAGGRLCRESRALAGLPL